MTDKNNNTGNHNTGDCNTGNRNTGDYNTGGWNTGNRNTGNRNTGNHNTGNHNTGNRNTGNHNTGNHNTGYCNTGGWNTGGCNTGCWNTGNHNTGFWNTGDWNTGHRNTGDWNTGNRNTGYFNTESPTTIRVFNKDCNINVWDSANMPDWLYWMELTQWIQKEYMTDAEKEKHPSYETIGGYLRQYDYKEAALKAWNETTQEDRDLTKTLPNFDADVFFEIFGIDVRVKKMLCLIY